VCSAVAAADLRAAWFLAFASFVAQSGRTLSVVMTVDALAEMEVVRLRAGLAGARLGLPVEFKEDDEDMAEEAAPREFPWLAYDKPLLNGGGSNVTPNSACWQ
jgi:hypothetical protein